MRMNDHFVASVLLGIGISISGTALSQAPEKVSEQVPTDRSEIAATSDSTDSNWMAETRLGMFIHFGLYSMPAGVWEDEEMGRNHYAEWIRTQWAWPRQPGIPKDDYDVLLSKFNPTEFDADEWIQLAANAGMKYFVITSKHHDGFALWDSKVSQYDIGATPFGATGRDLLGELVTACRAHDIKVGFYYSHWQDWEHAGGAKPPWPEIKPDPRLIQPTDGEFEKYWQGKCLPQVSELIERYQPDMFWFDTWGKAAAKQITTDRRDELIELVRTEAPNCMINGRIAAHATANADFISMGDNQFPSRTNAPKLPWETPGTMNHSWGYHRQDFTWKSFDKLLTSVIRNANFGGSVTLNVGPMGNGKFQAAANRRLKQFATWMDIHRNTLHGTQRGPFNLDELPDGVLSTLGVDRFYLHLVDPQGETKLSLPMPSGWVGEGNGAQASTEAPGVLAQVLETREFLPVSVTADQLSIELPKHLDDLDHPVIQVGLATAISHTYEDGKPVRPVKPGDFSR